MNTPHYPGRLGIVQRVLPAYRAPFFETLADACQRDLSLFAGQPRPEESIVTVSSLQKAKFFAANNWHLLSTSSPLYACYQGGLLNWLENWNPDALVMEANFRYLSSRAGLAWMKKNKRPVIGWGLGAPLERGLLSSLRRNFLARFDGMIAYSQRGASQYADCGIAPDRIFVAPNAVTPAPRHAMPVRPANFAGQPQVLFVGRLQARKRIPALLRACAALPAALKPHLVIVGDGPEAGSLQALAAEVYPAAEFTGARQGTELEPYFLAADLFVLPGTGGLAVQQAMSYGLPVIVAQGDGTQDDLVRPVNGWQIPADDDAALLIQLEQALLDAGRLRVMGAESYRIVAEEINIEKMVSVFTQALNTVS